MAQSVLSAPQVLNEEAAFAYVEKKLWPNGPICPHCGATEEHIGTLKGKTTRTGLRKCYACNGQFTVRQGTIFEDSHLALHLWLQVIHMMCCSKKGISTRQVQRMLQCSMKTAWFLTHRIREAMKDGSLGPLGGEGAVIEADETYVGQYRHMHKHYTHHVVNHRAQEYVRKVEGMLAHTNTAEGFFAILKRGITGVYHNISEAHLHRYLAEFDFRYSNREKLGVDDTARAERALLGVKGKRLTYERTRAPRA